MPELPDLIYIEKKLNAVLPGIKIIVHPMLAGRFMLTDGKGKAGRDLCLTINMESGSCLHYLDNKKMGKVYITKTGQYENIPRFNNQGIDILSAAFTLEKFQQDRKSV